MPKNVQLRDINLRISFVDCTQLGVFSPMADSIFENSIQRHHDTYKLYI